MCGQACSARSWFRSQTAIVMAITLFACVVSGLMFLLPFWDEGALQTAGPFLWLIQFGYCCWAFIMTLGGLGAIVLPAMAPTWPQTLAFSLAAASLYASSYAVMLQRWRGFARSVLTWRVTPIAVSLPAFAPFVVYLLCTREARERRGRHPLTLTQAFFFAVAIGLPMVHYMLLQLFTEGFVRLPKTTVSQTLGVVALNLLNMIFRTLGQSCVAKVAPAGQPVSEHALIVNDAMSWCLGFVFYRNLFTSVTSWETFLLLEAVELVSETLRFPFRLSPTYSRLKACLFRAVPCAACLAGLFSSENAGAAVAKPAAHAGSADGEQKHAGAQPLSVEPRAAGVSDSSAATNCDAARSAAASTPRQRESSGGDSGSGVQDNSNRSRGSIQNGASAGMPAAATASGEGAARGASSAVTISLGPASGAPVPADDTAAASGEPFPERYRGILRGWFLHAMMRRASLVIFTTWMIVLRSTWNSALFPTFTAPRLDDEQYERLLWFSLLAFFAEFYADVGMRTVAQRCLRLDTRAYYNQFMSPFGDHIRAAWRENVPPLLPHARPLAGKWLVADPSQTASVAPAIAESLLPPQDSAERLHAERLRERVQLHRALLLAFVAIIMHCTQDMLIILIDAGKL